MKIIFAGTPIFAAVILKALIEGSHDIIAVYTQPDRPAGRGQQLQASEVKQLAIQHHIPVYQPSSFRDPTVQAELAALKPDLMIVAVYGSLLPKEILDIPALGCLNVHASLLPKWRGAAPIARAIAAGDTKTGISMMKMVEALDAGPVFETFELPIDENDTHETLSEKLSQLSAEQINKTIDKIATHQLKAIPQDDALSSYAPKLKKEEAHINWNQSAETIARQVRAYNPWPVSFTFLNNQLIRVWAAEVLNKTSSEKIGTVVHLSAEGIDVSTSEGILRLTEIQLAGKSKIQAGALVKTQHPLFTLNAFFN